MPARFLRTVAVSASVFIGLLFVVSVPAAAQSSGEAVLDAKCSACHERQADGGLRRISDMRKTPEGWDMNIARMMIVHGVEVTPDERRALVKHLADTQGLAPDETKDWRYILEKSPNVIDDAPDPDLFGMCGRCHTFARVALQRRDEAEWVKLAHFHIGQFPTTEYQLGGRDRDWFGIATTDTAKTLGKIYPLKTAAWDEWRKKAGGRNFSGDWRVTGRQPGKGSYQGTAKVTAKGGDAYSVSLDVTFADGSTVSGKGVAIVYTGYEWRASLDQGGESVLQVMAASRGGNVMTGRWFIEDLDSVGASMKAIRPHGGHSVIMLVEPAYLRSGSTAKIAIHGMNLSGSVSLGAGVEIVSTVSASGETIVVEARAATGATAGARDVAVGKAKAAGGFVVYDAVGSVRVEPDTGIARVGGGGGPLAAVPAQFEAVAYANGADGQAGTDDDLRIGVMPAKWSIDNFHEGAAAMEDAKYAGAISAAGLFDPAKAGPNPDRVFGTNNVGDLLVKADVGGVEGTAHLYVTVQRWIDPPIR